MKIRLLKDLPVSRTWGMFRGRTFEAQPLAGGGWTVSVGGATIEVKRHEAEAVH